MSIHKELKSQIKRHGWWWRQAEYFDLKLSRPESRGGGRWNGQTEIGRHKTGMNYALGLLWKGGREVAAFRYELVRRLHPDKKLVPWPSLDLFQVSALTKPIGKSYRPTVAKITMGHGISTPDDASFTQSIAFNLSAANSALEQLFRQFILNERKRTGIRKPAPTPRNHVSWSWLETWDLSVLEGKPLDSSGSSMKSNAIREAVKWSGAVLDALS